MRLSPRFGAFLFLLLYSAFTVAGCFFIWSLEQTDTTWRLIWIGLVVSGFAWSLSEDLTLDQLLPRRGGARRQP